jgi:hypothetical protein
MDAVDSCHYMFFCTSASSFISASPISLGSQALDRHQDSVLVGVQEVCKTIPIRASMLWVARRARGNSMPSRLQLTGGPELHHVANVDENHVVEDGCVGPHLVGRRGWRGVVWRTDLEASDVLLEQERDRAPISVWADAMTGSLVGRLWLESGIMYELEVVKVGPATVVLRGELRFGQAQRCSDTFKQLQGPRSAALPGSS